MNTTTRSFPGPARQVSLCLIIALLGIVSACGESPAAGGGRDAGTEEDASDGSQTTDGEVERNRIITSAVGTLDDEASAVNDIAYGTFAKALLDGIVASEGSTVLVLDATTEPVGNPETTLLEPGMTVRLNAPGEPDRSYTLGFETLENETVVVVDGTLIRFETRFFTNSASEYIIVNKATGGGGTHYCIHADVETGTYGPQDEGNVGICLELFDPAGTNVRAGGYTNLADFDFVFDITVTETEMSGRYRGFVQRHGGDNALLPLIGFMHSDRVESGGWDEN
jgi:hypothetical protein